MIINFEDGTQKTQPITQRPPKGKPIDSVTLDAVDLNRLLDLKPDTLGDVLFDILKPFKMSCKN